MTPAHREVEDHHALVIGAGIAGAQVAYHLAERGWQVDVLERHSAPCLEGSGNPAAVFSPFLSAQPSLEERYSVQSFLYLVRQLARLDPDQRFHRQCGVLALSVDEEIRDRAFRIGHRELPASLVRPVDAATGVSLGGLDTGLDGLFYPRAGWVEPAAWIEALLAHDNIYLRHGAAVGDIVRRDGCWVALDDDGGQLGSAPVVVIASGRSMNWSWCDWVPTTPVAGQTTFVDADAVVGMPGCVVRYRGYLVPLEDHRYLIGSTYRRGNVDAAPDTAADRENWETLAADLSAAVDHHVAAENAISSAHAAIRMTSENRLPLVGALPDPMRMTTEYPAMLRRDYRPPTERPIYPPGLYLTAAWGSRGMTNAALGGELMACLINNEPSPLQASLCHALHPARSLVRRLKQGVR